MSQLTMTDEQIRQLCEEATPGPWVCALWKEMHVLKTMVESSPNWGVIGIVGEDQFPGPDGKFIAASRTVMPELIERAQKAEAELQTERAENRELRDILQAEHQAFIELRRERDAMKTELEMWYGPHACSNCRHSQNLLNSGECKACFMPEHTNWQPRVTGGAANG